MSSPRPPSLRSLRRRARSLHAFPALASLALLMPLAAQAAMPRVHAIVGARIVTAPGKAIERGTIVQRGTENELLAEDGPFRRLAHDLSGGAAVTAAAR